MRAMILGVTLTLMACRGEQEATFTANRQQEAWERPARPARPEIVSVKADIARLDGQWAEVHGTVTRTSFVAPVPVRRDGKFVAGRDEGTALTLEDGSVLAVNLGAPPPGWEGLIGQRVSVVALVWTTDSREASGGGASNQPSISSWEAPEAITP